MKRIKYVLILFLLFIGINNIEAFDTSLKVYDYAQVLTQQEEENLRKDINLFIANHNMDMAIVTVKYHEKSNTMNYADDFYDYNGFGIGSSYDGLIIVLDFTFGYRDVWISTSGKAINVYTDSRIDSMLDSIGTKIDVGYYETFDIFIEKANSFARLGIPSYNNNYYYEEESINFNFIIILSLIIPSIVIIIFVLKNKMVKKATHACIYLVNNSVVINKRSDQFLTTHTSSYRISDTSSSSSSSFSSTHRSSSGRIHGGGGRRF